MQHILIRTAYKKKNQKNKAQGKNRVYNIWQRALALPSNPHVKEALHQNTSSGHFTFNLVPQRFLLSATCAKEGHLMWDAQREQLGCSCRARLQSAISRRSRHPSHALSHRQTDSSLRLIASCMINFQAEKEEGTNNCRNKTETIELKGEKYAVTNSMLIVPLCKRVQNPKQYRCGSFQMYCFHVQKINCECEKIRLDHQAFC